MYYINEFRAYHSTRVGCSWPRHNWVALEAWNMPRFLIHVSFCRYAFCSVCFPCHVRGLFLRRPIHTFYCVLMTTSDHVFSSLYFIAFIAFISLHASVYIARILLLIGPHLHAASGAASSAPPQVQTPRVTATVSPLSKHKRII